MVLLCLAMLGFAWIGDTDFFEACWLKIHLGRAKIIVLLHIQLCQLRMLTPAAHHYLSSATAQSVRCQSALEPTKDFIKSALTTLISKFM